MKSINMLKQVLTAIILIAFVSSPAREKQGSEATGDAQKLAGSAKVMAACRGAKESKELWINNVRTIIYTGGDMWWDLFGSGNAFYGVPGTQDKSTMINANFAGSIWIGGLDAGGQLKVAAMTYRQTGYDFWPGPLDTTNASTDEVVCNDYDRIFYMTRAEVENQVFNGVVSDNIKKWPGNPLDISKPHGTLLAPFYDAAGDNFYDPTAGDYPAYDIYNTAAKNNLGVCEARLFGDATLWWVFNDKGDIHTETNGQSIGLEVRAQAFGFKTNDDINNMTFYSYEVINRSSFSLNKTYFTVWTDADLGNYQDDYVGCDIAKGLGFVYNSDGDDASGSGNPGYGEFPAALGCDFFKGPLADPNDGIDNDFDGPAITPTVQQTQYTGTDELGETIGMSKFLYYNNNIGSFPVQTTNPALASHFYNYMTGFWKDGSPFTEGGNAYGGSTPTNYAYPGELYPVRTGWNEFDAGNLAGDRRFLQSAGPFTLLPGAVNNVTFGLPWARSPVKNGNLFVVSLLKVADLKAQSLFDNCFKILDGPDAPELTIQEGNNELLIYLSNRATSNNYLNLYKEKDVTILGIPGQTATCLSNPDPYYTFEGYKVYQLKDPSVSQTDLEDETKAKLVFQSDVQNGVTRLINYNFDAAIGADIPKVKVEGSDKGIQTTFKVTEDAFATTDKKLINNKTYYFLAVAYAYNNYATYKADKDASSADCENFWGQKRPYLEGRKIKKAAGIPHMFDPEKDGTVSQSVFGYGPKITRIEGQGNGGNIMDLTDESVNAILSSPLSAIKTPTYQNGRGPIQVKVIDPLNVPNSVFTVKLLRLPASNTITVGSITYTVLVNQDGKQYYLNALGSQVLCNTNLQAPQAWTVAPSGTVAVNSNFNYGYKYVTAGSTLRNDSITWVLTNKSNNKMYQPSKSIKVGEEYYFADLGLSVNIQQVSDPGASFTSTVTNTGYEGDFIEATMTFADPTKQWLTGLFDSDDAADDNWIRSGPVTTQAPFNDYNSVDPDKIFGKILDGTWSPYALVGASVASGTNITVHGGPGYAGSLFGGPDANKPEDVDLRYLSSVDVVITADKNKWTRCVVFEMQDDSLLSENVTRHFAMRDHASVDRNGNVGDGIVTSDPNDADYIAARGMGWFPGYAINIETGERLNMAFGEDSYNFTDNGNDMKWNPTSTVDGSTYSSAFGGRHYVYVFGHGKDAVYTTTVANVSYAPLLPLHGKPIGAGKYDAGKQMYDQLLSTNSVTTNISSPSTALRHWPMRNVMRDAMWVNVPLLKRGYSFKDPANIPCDVKVRIRVRKPYRYGYSSEWSLRTPLLTNYIAHVAPVSSTGGFVVTTSTGYLPSDTSSTPQNMNMPMYEFNTSDIYTMFGDAAASKNALDYVRIVPNPYYAYSKYETSRIDNRVRVTNLPSFCTIKIFTMNGTLVRTFKRDVTGQEDDYTNVSDIKQSKRIPYLDWDLKNQYGIPVASGLYIFHIEAKIDGKSEEKILKWFGVMRPLDLQNY